MIEKRNMFMVWTLEEDALPPVVAIVENGRVIGYYHEGDRELNQPRQCEHFFDSEADANEYIRQRIAALKEAKKTVIETLKEIYSYQDGYDVNLDSPIKLEDFIPYSIQHLYKQKGSDNDKIKRLIRCIRTGRIEMDGRDIRLDDVSYIEWGQGCDNPELFLMGGERIVIKDYEDKHLLEKIFDKKS